MEKSFIHQARKTAITNFGKNYEELIQTELNKYGFHFLSDIELLDKKFSTPRHNRLPDLFLKNYKQWEVNLIIEVDGDVHGPDLQGANDRTKARNKDFNDTKYNYLIIHLGEWHEMGLSFKDKTSLPYALRATVLMVSEKLNQILLTITQH